jgi:hypothetical protein
MSAAPLCVFAHPAIVRGFLLAISEGSAFRKSLETTPQLQQAILIGFAQAGAVAATALAPLEPGNLRVFHVTARSHAEKRLELRVEDGHLDI